MKKSVGDRIGTSMKVHLWHHLALDDLHRTLRQRIDLLSRELKIPDMISKFDAVSFEASLWMFV